MSDTEDFGGCSVYNETSICQGELKFTYLQINVCLCVYLCVCLFIAADGGGKGEAFDFHCINPIMPIFVIDVVERDQGRQSISVFPCI